MCKVWNEGGENPFSFWTKVGVMTRMGCSRVLHYIQVCTVCPNEKEAIRDEVAASVAIDMLLASNRLMYQLLDGSSYLSR